LTALGQREKEFARELAKLRESGELQRQSIETQHKEVIAELSSDYQTRELNLTSQIENIRNELKTQTERSTEYLTALGQREKEFARELKQIVDEKHTTELKNSNLSHLLTAAQLLESQLQGELVMRQQMLSDLSVELKKLQGSFTWRITAPLRAVAKLFISSPSDSEAVSISSVKTSSIETNLAIADSSVNAIIEESTITQSEHPIIYIKETFMSSSPIVAATSLDELLAYHDADFIHCAYITLLGRVPDPEGIRYYLGRIRAGRAKIEIIDQIASSSEAKALSVSILGLQQALERYRWEKIPIIGSVIRSITRHDEISCQIRQIENNIYLLGKDTCKRFDRIEKNIAIVASESIKIDDEPDELNHLSSHAREIYFQLKVAALKQEFGGKK
jgi:phage host-nuclease inhibitor protein Gam